MPVQIDGRAASSTDSATWANLSEVRNVSERIGFVLGAGIGCIDLDHALVDGHLSEPARRILDAVGPTWVEVSPSGDGLHVWGRLPEGPGRVTSVDGQAVEIYSKGRYMTVTGKNFEDSPMRLADLSGLVL